jgi:plasmid stabilization system protein ParE
MANVKIAEVVRFDLVEIWKFIADDNPTAATETIEAIERKFNLLATQPEMGRNRSDLLKGLQTHPIGNYTIWFSRPKNPKALKSFVSSKATEASTSLTLASRLQSARIANS